MPRRGRARKRVGRRGQNRGGGGALGGGSNAASSTNGTGISRVPFTVLKSVTTAAAVLNFTALLNPTDAIIGADRLGGLSPFWDSFRFVQLHVDVMPNSSNVEALLVGAYTDDVFTTTAPGTVQNLLQLACKVYQTPNQSTPVRLWVPRRYLLRNSLNWWKVRGSTDGFEGDQGQIQFMTSAACTGTFNFIISGVCELKDPVANVDLMNESKGDEVFPTPTWQVVQIPAPQPPPPLSEEVSGGPGRSRSLPPRRM